MCSTRQQTNDNIVALTKEYAENLRNVIAEALNNTCEDGVGELDNYDEYLQSNLQLLICACSVKYRLLLAEQQYGFRTNHSTEYAAVRLVDTISKEMESGSTPTALYIDLSKAFDTLSFDILLYKLNYYG